MKPLPAACIVAILGMSSLMVEGAPVPGKPVTPAAKALAATILHHEGFPPAKVVGIRLTPAAAQLRGTPSAAGEKRVRVGAGRIVAQETESVSGPGSLQWIAAPGGGQVARIEVTSPRAGSLRVGLKVRELPAAAQLRFVGSERATRVMGPVSGAQIVEAARQHGTFWTPLTEGERQAIELWIPSGTVAARVRVVAESASHLEASPADFLKSAGAAPGQPCNQDVACVVSTDPGLANAARATAKMMFTENGSTYLCTGTLINDGDPASQAPYLYTAAHCIDSQAVAATLNTFWFYQAAACGGPGAGDYRQLSGGASLVYADGASDAALLRLTDAAPHGAWFSGWDAAPVDSGAALVALHHPMGAVKKASIGQSVGFSPSPGGASFTSVAWSVGSTEGGSSGSGIFTRAGNEYLLRGGLWGGVASCSSSGRIDDTGNRDYYSRLDQEAGRLGAWLKAASAPAADYTDMWWNPAESGWGMSIIQSAGNKVFTVLYTYDANGEPSWYVMPGGAWTSTAVLEGPIYRTRGTPLRDFDPSKLSFAVVGSARIEFASPDSGTLTVVIGGQATVKPVRRQLLD